MEVNIIRSALMTTVSCRYNRVSKIGQVGRGSIYGNSASSIAMLGERPGSDANLSGEFTNTDYASVERDAFHTLDNIRDSMTIHGGKGNFSFADAHVEPVFLMQYKDHCDYGKHLGLELGE